MAATTRTTDNYIWGEIATQLGAEEAIKAYWVNGPKAVDQRIGRKSLATGRY